MNLNQEGNGNQSRPAVARRGANRLQGGKLGLHKVNHLRDCECVRGIDSGLDGDPALEPPGELERGRVGTEEHDADVPRERQPGPHRQLLTRG